MIVIIENCAVLLNKLAFKYFLTCIKLSLCYRNLWTHCLRLLYISAQQSVFLLKSTSFTLALFLIMMSSMILLVYFCTQIELKNQHRRDHAVMSQSIRIIMEIVRFQINLYVFHWKTACFVQYLGTTKVKISKT